MKVLIRVVTSTTGNDHEFIGRQIGFQMIGRPFVREVVTFESEMTDQEFELLRDLTPGLMVHDQLCRKLAAEHAISVHSIKVIKAEGT